MLYTRSPSWRLVDSTVMPIFLPNAPLIKPRTLWACQPVAFMISASVAPLLRLSSPRTVAFLLPSRAPVVFVAALRPVLAGLAGLAFAALVGLAFAACLALCGFGVTVAVVLVDSGSSAALVPFR